jgi:hypothetical protein
MYVNMHFLKQYQHNLGRKNTHFLPGFINNYMKIINRDLHNLWFDGMHATENVLSTLIFVPFTVACILHQQA